MRYGLEDILIYVYTILVTGWIPDVRDPAMPVLRTNKLKDRREIRDHMTRINTISLRLRQQQQLPNSA